MVRRKGNKYAGGGTEGDIAKAGKATKEFYQQGEKRWVHRRKRENRGEP